MKKSFTIALLVLAAAVLAAPASAAPGSTTFEAVTAGPYSPGQQVTFSYTTKTGGGTYIAQIRCLDMSPVDGVIPTIDTAPVIYFERKTVATALSPSTVTLTIGNEASAPNTLCLAEFGKLKQNGTVPVLDQQFGLALV